MGIRGFYIGLKVAMIFIYHLAPCSAEVKNAVMPYAHLHGVVCRDPCLRLPNEGKGTLMEHKFVDLYHVQK
jgi:hypothetical protein